MKNKIKSLRPILAAIIVSIMIPLGVIIASASVKYDSNYSESGVETLKLTPREEFVRLKETIATKYDCKVSQVKLYRIQSTTNGHWCWYYYCKYGHLLDKKEVPIAYYSEDFGFTNLLEKNIGEYDAWRMVTIINNYIEG